VHDVRPARFAQLSDAVVSHAISLNAQLPPSALVASELVTKLGHTPSNAVAFLAHFPPYAHMQRELLNAAVAQGAWSGSRSGGVKTVRGVAHAIKGAASMIGALRFAHASKLLQHTAEKLGESEATADDRDATLGAVALWLAELEYLLTLLAQEDHADLVARTEPHTSPWAAA